MVEFCCDGCSSCFCVSQLCILQYFKRLEIPNTWNQLDETDHLWSLYSTSKKKKKNPTIRLGGISFMTSLNSFIQLVAV